MLRILRRSTIVIALARSKSHHNAATPPPNDHHPASMFKNATSAPNILSCGQNFPADKSEGSTYVDPLLLRWEEVQQQQQQPDGTSKTSPFINAVTRNAATGQLEATCTTAKFLLDLNIARSHQFTAEPFASERERHLAQHPTEIIAFTCMDGRLNLDLYTALPAGVVVAYRNVAGKFDLGWPKLRESLINHVMEATQRGHRTIALCTYHFSTGCHHRGCRGMNFDTEKAKECAEHLAEQFRSVFEGGTRAAVFPIVVGIETDQEALVFHGNESSHVLADQNLSMTAASVTASFVNKPTTPSARSSLRTSDFAAREVDTAALRSAVLELFRGLDHQLVDDLMPILVGNAKHVYQRSQQHIPIIELDHRETVIAVGMGFGNWLHVPNKALVIGPYDHLWTKSVATAASVVTNNVKTNAVDASEGIVLVAATLCTAPPGSWKWRMAEMTSRYVARASQLAIAEQKELLNATQVHVLVGVVERSTLRFHVIES